MQSVMEKTYYTMKHAGIVSLVTGIVVLVTGIVAGVLAIVTGAILIHKRTDLQF